MKPLSTNLKQRMVVGSLGTALMLTVLYYSTTGMFKLVFTTFIALVLGLALWEFYQIARAKGYNPLSKLGISAGTAYIFAVFAATQLPAAGIFPPLVLGITLLAAFLYYFNSGTEPTVNLAITFFGLAYLILPLVFIISINYYFPSEAAQKGPLWLFYVVAVVKMTDVGAYFCGKTWGSKKMTPYISPKKTWEGAAGGLITAVAASLLLCTLTALDLPWTHSIALGVIISLLGQFGDLAESLLKRDMGVKDSNHLPGLGGMLDILDSLVFAIPFMYLYLKITHGNI